MLMCRMTWKLALPLLTWFEQGTCLEASDPLFQDILGEFHAHTALKHPLFEFLSNLPSISAHQFDVYRTNYAYRNELTAPSVAKTIVSAAEFNDFETMAESGINLFEELGSGNPSKVHAVLLLQTHNEHGDRVFGLPALSREDIRKSPLLIPEVRRFHEMKMHTFSKTYQHILGNTCAHELAANSMLVVFKAAFFDRYKALYTEQEYVELMEFFSVHMNESAEVQVEERHGEMACSAAARASNTSTLGETRNGGLTFLKSQADLLDGLLHRLQQCSDFGTQAFGEA